MVKYNKYNWNNCSFNFCLDHGMESPNDSPAESKAETPDIEMALSIENDTSSPLNEGNLNSMQNHMTCDTCHSSAVNASEHFCTSTSKHDEICSLQRCTVSTVEITYPCVSPNRNFLYFFPATN